MFGGGRLCRPDGSGGQSAEELSSCKAHSLPLLRTRLDGPCVGARRAGQLLSQECQVARCGFQAAVITFGHCFSAWVVLDVKRDGSGERYADKEAVSSA